MTIDQDSDSSLRSYFLKIQERQQRAKALPDSDPSKVELLNQVKKDKADYNLRVKNFKALKKGTPKALQPTFTQR